MTNIAAMIIHTSKPNFNVFIKPKIKMKVGEIMPSGRKVFLKEFFVLALPIMLQQLLFFRDFRNDGEGYIKKTDIEKIEDFQAKGNLFGL